MIYKDKEIVLKNKERCILRSPNEQEAEKLINYMKKVSNESHFLVRYPEEVNFTILQEKQIINSIRRSDKDIMISVFIDNDIVANLGINCVGDNFKTKHRCSLGIAIIKKYQGLGLGNILIDEAVQFARYIGYEQIELGVFEDNIKARNLYHKHGFEVWGKNKNGFKLKNNTYKDDIIMGKFL